MRTSCLSFAVGIALVGCRGHAPGEVPPGSGGIGAGTAANPGAGTGASPGSAGATWVRAFGGGGEDVAHGVVLGEDGATVVGYFHDTIALPAGEVRAVGDADLFAARLDRAGGVRWFRGFGSLKADFAWGVAMIGDLTVIAAESDGTLNVDGVASRTPAQEEAGETPAVAIALDEAGRRVWLRALASEAGTLHSIAGAGDAVVVGGRATTRTESLDLGSGAMKCDQQAGVVVRWPAAGGTTWARCGRTKFGSASQLVEHLSVGADGAVAACGAASGGSLSFGGPAGAIDEVDPAPFVATFGRDGAPGWIVLVSSPARTGSCSGVVALDDGTVVFATASGGAINGVPLPAGAIVALVGGTPQWVASLPELAGGKAGNVEAITQVGGHVFATGVVDRRAVVVEVDGVKGTRIGEPRWLGAMEPEAIAADASRIVVVGRLRAPATIVGQEVVPVGGVDAIAVGLAR